MRKQKNNKSQAPVPLKDCPFTSKNYGNRTILTNLVHAHSQLPEKKYEDDIGFDVTLVERLDGKTEDLVGEVTLFSAGLQIKPPEGYYIELVPRSSLYKEGYMLVNSVGIIDPSYRGEVIAALYKFREGDDLKLPCKCMQFILRKAEYAYIGFAEEGQMDETERGDGGFGSTNEKKPSKRGGVFSPDFDEDSKGKEKVPINSVRKQQNTTRRGGNATFFS